MILGGIALIIFIIGLCITRPWTRYYSDNKIYFDIKDFVSALLLAIVLTGLIWVLNLMIHSAIEGYEFDNNNIKYFTEVETEKKSLTNDGVYFDIFNGKYYIHYYGEEQIPLIYEVKSNADGNKRLHIYTDVSGEPPIVIIHTYKAQSWLVKNMLIPTQDYLIYDIYLPSQDLLHIIEN